jgi:hypothetical protein
MTWILVESWRLLTIEKEEEEEKRKKKKKKQVPPNNQTQSIKQNLFSHLLCREKHEIIIIEVRQSSSCWFHNYVYSLD